jgi:hypothetical protein
MAPGQANYYAAHGELSPAGRSELTVMRKLNTEGSPEAYELKIFRDLDQPRFRKKLKEYHNYGLPLASKVKAMFGRSLASEIALIRLVRWSANRDSDTY